LDKYEVGKLAWEIRELRKELLERVSTEETK